MNIWEFIKDYIVSHFKRTPINIIEYENRFIKGDQDSCR